MSSWHEHEVTATCHPLCVSATEGYLHPFSTNEMTNWEAIQDLHEYRQAYFSAIMASFTHANYSFSYPVNGVVENCRQAAAQQGPWGMMPNGMVVQQQQWVQQNGQTQMSRDLQRPTSFTNGRKRSRENIECEEMKKAKTEMETQFLQMQQGFINQGFSNVAIAQHQMQLQMQQQQQGFNSCFPSSLIEHQSLMRAEKQYDGSILASLVAEAHGC